MAGTVHLRRGEALELVATLNIPPPVMDAVRVVPRGKGMAGLALGTGEPVQTCNLQADESGRIQPGDRRVPVRAAVALPVLDAAGEVRAVVGIAFLHEGDLSSELTRALMAAAAELPLAACEPMLKANARRR
ncbi:GAF domain-containing protein [Archangium lansingense]|uniref:GAF domain-containing protein n=1 Tax=Archangium lansingense TaxID=2995310 RepID=A0ABT4AP03_9BACT|nr:GAF domain-containing protein [Archangium lansinium]MCY1082584.1 GAF domain-containing protein [Archangium lansinium]